ncbi:mevalonate kinase [Candidatus Aenigmatarchaeota archaeon]
MEGYGYGKVILFNEHFVVYGIPSIASALGDKTTATVEENDRFVVIDNRPEIPGYKVGKAEAHKDAIQRILKKMGLEDKKIKITMAGNLIAASGVGSSAASCASIARALSNFFKMNLSDEEINEIAYEGEKGYHGTPSGIDNTAATYGGLIWFIKGNPSVMERIKIKEPVEIVMANTGLVADTKAAVAGVKERKEKYSDKYNEIFKESEELAHKARKAIEDFDLKTIGNLMNKNHELLQNIEVSHEKLDYLVNLAKEKGAWGAKMTGGGLGGYMYALTPGEELQEKVAKVMKDEGFLVLKTKIGI